jgi:hypothetical protein
MVESEILTDLLGNAQIYINYEGSLPCSETRLFNALKPKLV